MSDTYRVSNGGMKDLIVLFLPIALISLSSAFLFFLEKLLFVRLGDGVMEAAVNVSFICRIFQVSCTLLAMMAQVFVGRLYGAQDWKAIGPTVWQFIWFSLLSMIVTVPASLIYGKYYLQGTSFEALATPYFHFIIGINFLYPLGAALSCFYLGRGKTKMVVFARLGAEILTAILAYFLIFGNGIIPAMGLMGGAISTLIGQGSFCLLLLAMFLGHVEFGSRFFQLNIKLFWECIQPGLLRAISAASILTSWSFTSHLMVTRGESYLLILSIGGTLFAFFSCLADAILQGMTTVVSQLLGAKKYSLLKRAFRSGALLALILSALLAIPLLLYPIHLFNLLFPGSSLDPISIHKLFSGIWLCISFLICTYLSMSFVLAFKDTRFSLFMGIMTWINGYLIMSLAIKKIGIAANQFWIVLAIMHFLSASFYFMRRRWLISSLGREDSLEPTP